MAFTSLSRRSITIANDAEITAGDFGIEAKTYGSNSGIQIDNDGYITAALNDPSDPPSGADGIYAFTEGTNSPISIKNAGNIEVSGAFVPASPTTRLRQASMTASMPSASVATAPLPS